MIKSVKVTNHLGESLVMELENPGSSGFAITSISGLNPPHATINTTEMAASDGSSFNSARAESRNIVITFKFMDLPIEECRRKSYKYFPVKKKIRLDFVTDKRECYIYGYVESNAAEYFSAMTATQISIICPFPWFRDLYDDYLIFSGLESLFEFPFSNNSLSGQLIVMGEYTAGTSGVVEYSGEMDSGMEFKLHFTNTISTTTTISIYKVHTEYSMILDVTKMAALKGGYISAGDDIIINTKAGEKGVSLLSGGVYYDALSCINQDADWFTLNQGENEFAYLTDPSSQEIYNIEFSISSPTLYQGV